MFKLGNEKRGIKNSKNVTIFRKHMGDGALAQANMDGSIDVDPSVNLDSRFGRRVIAHEANHLHDMETGRAAYGDTWVMWEDNIYMRGEERGVKYIYGPNGRWPDGPPNHPWEAEGIQSEKLINKK